MKIEVYTACLKKTASVMFWKVPSNIGRF